MIKSIAEKKPLLSSGLALGLAALGNLMGKYGQDVRYLFGCLSLFFFVIITVFIIKNFDIYLEEIKNPIVASVFGTYSMAGMLLSTYLAPVAKPVALVLWLFFILLHIVLIVVFTLRFTLKRKILQVFPSWFIIYVGIVVASVTAPLFDMIWIGKTAFWFGLVTYLILLPIVFYRIIKVKQIPEPVMPNIAINAAPAALLLAGYLNSFQQPNAFIVYFLIGLSQILFIYVLTQLPKIMTVDFSPAFSAFTFPFVITAISVTAASNFLANAVGNLVFMPYVVLIETWFTVIMVSYIMVLYIRHFLKH